jgi:hypothetical protein
MPLDADSEVIDDDEDQRTDGKWRSRGGGARGQADEGRAYGADPSRSFWLSIEETDRWKEKKHRWTSLNNICIKCIKIDPPVARGLVWRHRSHLGRAGPVPRWSIVLARTYVNSG